MRTINILPVILFTFFALPLLAQDGPLFSVGVYSNSNYSQHAGTHYSIWSSSISEHYSFKNWHAHGVEYGIQGKIRLSRHWVGILGTGKAQWNKKYNIVEILGEHGQEEKSLLFEGKETYKLWAIQIGAAAYPFQRSSPYFSFKFNYNQVVGYEFDPIDVITPSSSINPTPKYQNRQQAFDGALLFVFEIGGRIFLSQNISINPFVNFQYGKKHTSLIIDSGVSQLTAGLNLDWWF